MMGTSRVTLQDSHKAVFCLFCFFLQLCFVFLFCGGIGEGGLFSGRGKEGSILFLNMQRVSAVKISQQRGVGMEPAVCLSVYPES